MTRDGKRRRVVVTGMCTVNPLGSTLEDYWHGLIEGSSTAKSVERYPTDWPGTKLAWLLDDFDPAVDMDLPVAPRDPLHPFHAPLLQLLGWAHEHFLTAKCIGAVLVDHVVRVDDVSARL